MILVNFANGNTFMFLCLDKPREEHRMQRNEIMELRLNLIVEIRMKPEEESEREDSKMK